MMSLAYAVLQDLRFALRQFRRQPGFALTAIVVLALGIGSSTAVFSVLYQTLLKPLPYPQPSRLFAVHTSLPKSILGEGGLSALDYLDLQRQHQVFSQVGAYYFNDATMTGAGLAQHVDPVNASASLFSLLGVKPALGRMFRPEEDHYGAEGVAVLSNALWRGSFGADPGVLGRSIRLDGKPYRIVGVMPATFQFPYPATQLWLPLALKPKALAENARGNAWLRVVARLAFGVTEQRARKELAGFSRQMAQAYPDAHPVQAGWQFAIRPLSVEQSGAVRRWILLAFGAVLCVLAIAYCNVGGLLLIRWTGRSGEMAVRAALGAGRGRLVRQLLMETAGLVMAGCCLGCLVAVCAVDFGKASVPGGEGTQLNGSAVAFAIGTVFLGTLAAGLWPAVLGTRSFPYALPKMGATQASVAAGRWRLLLVAAQLGVAITLLFLATLLSRSFLELTNMPTGFVAQRVWSGSIQLPNGVSPSFFLELQERIRAVPGVEATSACNDLPFNPSGSWSAELWFVGKPEPKVRPAAVMNNVLPGYFETMRIPLLRGRKFTEADEGRGGATVIVNQEFVRRYFLRNEPIGQLVADSADHAKVARIIGVVGDVVNSELGGPPVPEMYWPGPAIAMYLVARVHGNVDVDSAIRTQIAKLNPEVALFDVRMMESRVRESLRLRQFVAEILGGFAAVGLVLAGFGLYGSLAYLVVLRRREIGIRMALGAEVLDIVGLLGQQVRAIVLIGVGVGAGGSFVAGRLIQSQFFQVRGLDSWSCAVVCGVTGLVVILAGLLPGWRAVRVQPTEVLREE